MSGYKMNPYELQSYFKSSCNSFYIAYDQVKRLEKERDILLSSNKEEELKIVNNLLNVQSLEDVKDEFLALRYPLEELLEEKEQLEEEQREYRKKCQELESTFRYWTRKMWEDYDAVDSVLKTIRNNNLSIIVTTKAEVYALICFYACYGNPVHKYPIVNIEEEYRKVFEIGEEVYKDFLYAYEEDIKCETSKFMSKLYEKYF